MLPDVPCRWGCVVLTVFKLVSPTCTDMHTHTHAQEQMVASFLNAPTDPDEAMGEENGEEEHLEEDEPVEGPKEIRPTMYMSMVVCMYISKHSINSTSPMACHDVY